MDQLRTELMRHFAIVLLALVAAACTDHRAVAAAPETPSAGIIDSVLPIDEALRRFRVGLPTVSELSGGAESPDELVRLFEAAVVSGDSISLRRLVLDRGEYGWLYYPTSVYSQPPYELPPETAWMLSSEENAKAVRRLARKLAGQPIHIATYTCAEAETRERNRIMSDCSVSLADDDGTVRTRRFFKSMIERDGQVKFLSLAGDL